MEIINTIAARVPKGGDNKGNGYSRICNKCKVLLRASWTGTKTMPNPDSVVWCLPCWEAKNGKMKGARR